MAKREFNPGFCALSPRDLTRLQELGVVDPRLTMAGLAARRCLMCFIARETPATVQRIGECAGVARLTVTNQVSDLQTGGFVERQDSVRGPIVAAETGAGRALAEIAHSIPAPLGCSVAIIRPGAQRR